MKSEVSDTKKEEYRKKLLQLTLNAAAKHSELRGIKIEVTIEPETYQITVGENKERTGMAIKQEFIHLDFTLAVEKYIPSLFNRFLPEAKRCPSGLAVSSV